MSFFEGFALASREATAIAGTRSNIRRPLRWFGAADPIHRVRSTVMVVAGTRARGNDNVTEFHRHRREQQGDTSGHPLVDERYSMPNPDGPGRSRKVARIRCTVVASAIKMGSQSRRAFEIRAATELWGLASHYKQNIRSTRNTTKPAVPSDSDELVATNSRVFLFALFEILRHRRETDSAVFAPPPTRIITRQQSVKSKLIN